MHFCQDFDIINTVTQEIHMSGDSTLNEQPLIFYSSEMTSTKKVLIELKREDTNQIVEIQGVQFQKRWRKGSCMEE